MSDLLFGEATSSGALGACDTGSNHLSGPNSWLSYMCRPFETAVSCPHMLAQIFTWLKFTTWRLLQLIV